MITFRTYKAVWAWEKVMYRFQDLRLPFPIALRAIGYFFGIWVAVSIPAREVLHLPGGWILWYVVLPFITAGWLTNARLDGRPPLLWMQAMITWALMPKRWADGHPLQSAGWGRFKAACKKRTAQGRADFGK